MTNLEILKTEFINALDWNEEEGLICNNDGQNIRDFLETYAKEISEKIGMDLISPFESFEKEEFLESDSNRIVESNLNFADDNKHIDFYLNLEFDYDNTAYFIAKNFENENEKIYTTNLSNNGYTISFTLYTSVNYSEKLEELKNRIEA